MKGTQGKYRACVRRRTQRRDKREGAKAVKEEEVLRQERRIQLDRRRTQGKYGRRNGTTERIGTEKWRGRQGLKKEKTPEQRAHTGKARKTHKKPHMKTPHIY